MKSFKSILIAALSLTVSNGLMAQASQNANINANATVIQGISVTGQEALEFGTVVAGEVKTIELNGDISAGDNTSVDGVIGNQAGRFLVSAAATSGVTLSFTNIPNTLSNGSETMGITYTAGWSNNIDATSTTEVDVTEAVTTDIISFPENDLSGTNGIYVFLGGTVTAVSGQAPGVYTAEVTMSAVYN